MAFLRVEKKKSGNYLRIMESYKQGSVSKHRTLYSLGKAEDYKPDQLKSIGQKFIDLSGIDQDILLKSHLKEIGRYNYGYPMIVKKLWNTFRLDDWARRVKGNSKVEFDWVQAIQLMVVERLNEPLSKRQNYLHQNDYIGLGEKPLELHQFYRCLDLMHAYQESLKKHLMTTQQNLFSQSLDVVFYDVTSIHFESSNEVESSIRQKGWSKNGKAHKVQIILGLLIDKFRNPLSYTVYKGNTWEGETMEDALKELRKNFNIDEVIIVADSAMICKDNREKISNHKGYSYIIGDRIRNLPKEISGFLINKANHKPVKEGDHTDIHTYCYMTYQDRTIFCTYSRKRAKKDAAEREKLIMKAEKLLSAPSKLKNNKRKGAGRFIKPLGDEKYALDQEKIQEDVKWDGYKAISTTTKLSIEEILEKYSDLFEVEHSFRTLKSQLEIRPIFHWNNERILGHIAMSFIAYTMLNYLRNTTKMQLLDINRTMDKMQMSLIDTKDGDNIYLRSKMDESQETILKTLKLTPLNDIIPQSAVNQYIK